MFIYLENKYSLFLKLKNSSEKQTQNRGKQRFFYQVHAYSKINNISSLPGLLLARPVGGSY